MQNPFKFYIYEETAYIYDTQSETDIHDGCG